MSSILAFAGSARRASLNRRLIAFASERARALGGEVTLIDLADFPMPLYDGDLEEREGLLVYHCGDAEVPEEQLSDSLSFIMPEERLLAGQCDDLLSFDLAGRTGLYLVVSGLSPALVVEYRNGIGILSHQALQLRRIPGIEGRNESFGNIVFVWMNVLFSRNRK